MISRFIEAKPDELRLFIEEAAGISKYKERRRETENRIRHTRENLDRLNDLRDEVGKQLKHLERQAETAEKYRALKAEERRVLEDELTALRWRELDRTRRARARARRGRGGAGGQRAEQRRLEAQIEADRDAHAEASDGFNAVQGRYYAVGAEIARLEQAIRFADREPQPPGGGAGPGAPRAGRRRRPSRARHERLGRTHRGTGPRRAGWTEVGERLAAPARSWPRPRTRLDAWQAGWDALQEGPRRPHRARADRARAHQRPGAAHHARRAARGAHRQDREPLDTTELAARLTAGGALRWARRADRRGRGRAGRSADALRRLDEERAAVAARLDAARTELQTCRGRQASLEALQDAALEHADDAVGPGSRRRVSATCRACLDSIEVDAGWEPAVEAVLGGHAGRALRGRPRYPRPGSMRPPRSAGPRPAGRPDPDPSRRRRQPRGRSAAPGRWPDCCTASASPTPCRRPCPGAPTSGRASASSPATAAWSAAIGSRARRGPRRGGQPGARRDPARPAGEIEDLEQVIAELVEQDEALAERRQTWSRPATTPSTGSAA
jgi:chromosome segregation protein